MISTPSHQRHTKNIILFMTLATMNRANRQIVIRVQANSEGEVKITVVP